MDSITGYHVHRYVALSVIGHRMCNRISGLCDKSSITIVTKRYRETSLVCCLRYYYSCYALVIIRGNQLVIFPGIALYYGNTSIVSPCMDINVDICLYASYRIFCWGGGRTSLHGTVNWMHADLHIGGPQNCFENLLL